MTIPLDGSEGLFTRIGLITAPLDAVVAHLTATATLVDDIAAEYQTTDTSVIAGADGPYAALDAYNEAPASFLSYLSGLAQSTVIQMAQDDAPMSAETLAVALDILKSQMDTASESLNRPTITFGTPAYNALNVGDGALIGSVLSADGSFQPYVFNETVLLVCSADQATGATAGSEPFTVTTPASVDYLAHNWPQGSGVNGTLTTVNPALDATGGNLLTNGDFNDFTVANTPDDWDIEVGTVGADILSSTSVYAGDYCLNLAYQAAGPLTELRQLVSVSGATPYILSFMAKRSSGLTGVGVLTVALVDENGTVLVDPQGNNCSTTFTLSGWTTSYVRKNFTTWTPSVLPSNGVYVQIKITTAIADAGESIYLDWGALTSPSLLYSPGGPFLALFAGATDWAKGDRITVAVNNNYGGLLIAASDRLLGLREADVVLPTSGSPTVADSLIP